MTWTAGGSSHSYAFTYDGLNRMLNATHDTNAYTEKVTGYDKNGNITGLQRYANGLIDNLTYTYNGNRLTKVEDATDNATGFTDGASQANEYTYDNNGNLTQDLNKGITNISYNFLNLPQQIRYSNGVVVNYGYSADGVKQRVQHLNSGLPNVVYCGNVIYEGDVAKLLLTEEGYIDLANGNAYYYYLKDHQGNNRVVVSSSGTVMETNHYYPFGGVFSTSTNVQPYKYNGKELDTKAGLNWYDYGARHYDATLGRWFVMDPLAEKMYGWSPYGYCFNNPIKLVDIDGKYPGPGDLFVSKREAAKDWGKYYNGASILRKCEMFSVIYEVKEGNKIKGYSYNEAIVSDAHKVSTTIKDNENIAATIHSHGEYNGIFVDDKGNRYMVKDNEFSEADKATNKKIGVVGYVATPNGSLLEHNPISDKISTISASMPSDPNDPKRLNKIEPIDNTTLFSVFMNFINGLLKRI